MKRIALVGLSILALSLAATTSVKAETQTETLAMSTAPTIVNNSAVKTKITPFGLVYLAYQGEYRMQGIPGFSSLQSAIYDKTITAKDLVKVAIDAKQLPPDTQTDRAYLNAVELHLSVTRN
jgi:hypothetical protein